MISIEQKIKIKLMDTFNPLYLQIVNQSEHHQVPRGSESHFKVILVSQDFMNMPLLKRHRAVYQVLTDVLAGPVHALALHTYTVQEWKKLADSTPTSPVCYQNGKKNNEKQINDPPW